MRWDVAGRLPEAFYQRLYCDARFPGAVRLLAANMKAASRDDPKLDGIFKDAGRYVCAMWSMHLHATGGLTLPRLKEFCATSGYLSPGRARALLLYLRYLGYVEPLRPVAGQPPLYAPTGSLTAAWLRHLKAALEAASLLEHSVTSVMSGLDEADVLEEFSRLQAGGLHEEAKATDQNNAFIRIFAHRSAGLQMVGAMLLADPDDTFPPKRPIAVSLNAWAQRFKVSRIHIRRMLDAAVREGLIQRNQDGAIILTESLQRELEFFYGGQLLSLLRASARTLKARPELARRTQRLAEAPAE